HARPAALTRGFLDRPGCSPGLAPASLCSERCGSSLGPWDGGTRAGSRCVVMIGSLTLDNESVYHSCHLSSVMIKLLSSTSLAEFKDRECPGQREARDYTSPRLPGPFVPYGPPGDTVVAAGERAAGPAKGCRQMSKDPVSRTKDVRAAVDAELGFDPLVHAARHTVKKIARD